MLVSAGIISLLSLLLAPTPWLLTLLKVVIEAVIFYISYRIQNAWVFSTAKNTSKTKITTKVIVKRSLLSVLTALLLAIITIFSGCLVAAHGPSKTIRDMLVLSAMQASATKWVPYLFLPADVVNQIVADSHKISVDSIGIDDIEQIDADEWENAKNGTLLYYVQKPNFKAYVLLVKDPKRVKLGVSSENFSSATAGINIFNFAKKYNALAVVNAGEFYDGGGQGTGAQPLGLTYSFGKKVWGEGGSRTFMGFTDNDELVCFNGITTQKAEELGMRDAVSFQTGNLLINNNKDKEGNITKVNYYYGDKNLGAAQRTAIGQCADGSVIFIVTDGRSASSIGATRNDIIDLLKEYGAVSAGMLDGGSSSMLYYRNYPEVFGVDTSKLDDYQKQGLVNQYKAFTPPRRLPTCFIVTEE